MIRQTINKIVPACRKTVNSSYGMPGFRFAGNAWYFAAFLKSIILCSSGT